MSSEADAEERSAAFAAMVMNMGFPGHGGEEGESEEEKKHRRPKIEDVDEPVAAAVVVAVAVATGATAVGVAVDGKAAPVAGVDGMAADGKVAALGAAGAGAAAPSTAGSGAAEAATTISAAQLQERKDLKWTDIMDRAPRMIGLYDSRPYPADILGRYLIVEDQFCRFYPPGMVVAIHPNQWIIGVVWFESMKSVANEERRRIVLGIDAFPSTNQKDYETYTPDRLLQVPVVRPETVPDPPQQQTQNSQNYQIHWLANSFFRDLLYTEWAESGPWQFQRYLTQEPLPDDVSEGVAAAAVAPALPQPAPAGVAAAAVAPALAAPPQVAAAVAPASPVPGLPQPAPVPKEKAEGVTPRFEGVVVTDAATSFANIADEQREFFCKPPAIMKQTTEVVSLPTVAETGRALRHSWPLPYHVLTAEELALADKLWKEHQFPVLSDKLVIRRTAAVRALMLHRPSDFGDEDE